MKMNRRNIVLGHILLVALIFILMAAVTPTSAETGLVAYYPFDGDTNDHSGNGNDGTNHGATFVSGTSGQGLSFDGADDFVSAPVNINPDVMPEMTMVAWVRPDDGSPIKPVISHDNGGYDRSLGIDSRGGGVGWSAFSGSGNVLGYHPVTIGEWVFIAAVYDQDAETVKLFVNGALINEEKGSLGTGWEHINIGTSPSYGKYFSGIIDEVKIYNYALSTAEIKSLYETTPTAEPELVAYYPFDGDTSDHSGNGNDGINNGATFVSGTSGQALSFDGTDDYVSAPVNISPDVMPQMTMLAWVRPDDDSPIKQVISHDHGGYDRSLGIDSRGGGTGWSAFSGSGGVLGYHPVTIGEWVFVAAVYDQDAETVKLYVNEAMYEEKGSLGPGWEYIHIGSNPSFVEYFSGIIDEVKIYNYALSNADIQKLYAGGVPTPVTPTPTTTTTTTTTPTVTPTETECDETARAIVNAVGGCEALDKSKYPAVYEACCKVTKESLLKLLDDALTDGTISSDEKEQLLSALNKYLEVGL
ncbi:MAG: LamG domain-containing protein [Halobacteriota archaeon]